VSKEVSKKVHKEIYLETSRGDHLYYGQWSAMVNTSKGKVQHATVNMIMENGRTVCKINIAKKDSKPIYMDK